MRSTEGDVMETILYIIGNGFDAANKLPTSYEHFRKYLTLKYKENQSGSYQNYYEIQKKGKLSPNDYQNSRLLIKMIDTALKRVYGKKMDWRYFEAVLGKLKYEDLWGNQEKNELSGILVHTTFIRLRDYFKDWISNVEVEHSQPIQGFQNNDRALYLSFNYTLTLEKVYHIPSQKVCHIHGALGDENLMFGHKYCEEKPIKNETGAERQISIVREMLEKDTRSCYREHRDFFQKIDKQIREIVSIGFSYSDVDMYYIDNIIKSVGNNTVWYIHNYKVTDAIRFKLLLRIHGFHGKIKFFKNINFFPKG